MTMTTRNEKEPWKIPAGKLFFFSEGSYSDYGIVGTFLALEELNEEKMKAVVEEIRATKFEFISYKFKNGISTQRVEKRLPSGDYEVRSKFVPMMIRKGWLVDIDMQEIHLGDYGEVDLCHVS